jgi:hypothetical protein
MRAKTRTNIIWDNPDQQPALQALAAALGIYIPTIPNAKVGNVTRLILTLADATIERGPQAIADQLREIMSGHQHS